MPDTPAIALRLTVNADRQAREWTLDSPHIERFWLPILGPTSTALLRWCARHHNDLPASTASKPPSSPPVARQLDGTGWLLVSPV